MKISIKKIKVLIGAFLVLCSLVLTGCVSTGAYDQMKAQLKADEEKITSLQTSIQDMQSELDSSKAAQREAEIKLSLRENDLKTAQQNLEAAQAKLQTSQQDLIDTRIKLADTQKALSDSTSKLNYYLDTLGTTVFSNVQPPYTKTSSPTSLIALEQNPDAANPTWQELMTFIKSDPTDSLQYVEGTFMCGAFAEKVHNNAEKAGIRSAIAAIHFADSGLPHAIDVFKTTDFGLVFVDCTGWGYQQVSGEDSQLYSSWDKIAYIRKDREYGTLGILTNSSTAYSFYETAKADWAVFEEKLAVYNADVEKFNLQNAGKVYYVGTPEYQRMRQRESELIQQSETLNELKTKLLPMWEPLGKVSSIEIYW